MKRFRVTIHQDLEITVPDEKDAQATAEHIARYVAPVSFRDGFAGGVRFTVNGAPAVILSVDGMASHDILDDRGISEPQKVEQELQKTLQLEETEDDYDLF